MEESIYLKEIIKTLKKYLWAIVLFAILGGFTGNYFSEEEPAPTYEATSLFFIDQSGIEVNDVNNQTEESSRFYNTAQTIITTPAILNKVIEKQNLDKSSKELAGQVQVLIENNSKIIKVIVEDSDAKQATNIVNGIVKAFEQEIGKYLDVEKVQVIQPAKIGDENQIVHARPRANLVMGVIVGGVLGTVLAFSLNFLTRRKRKS